MNIWAHRGCSNLYPENTLPAFEAACKISNITGIELDIQLSNDGHVVVFHDEFIDRTTNGKGPIYEYSLYDLKQFKIELSKGKEYKGFTSIPTIEEVISLVLPYCKKNGLLLNIELKNNKVRHLGMEEKILNIVAKYNLEDYVFYTSFNANSLKLLKKLKADIKLGILTTRLSEGIALSKEIEVDALLPHIDWIEEEAISLAKGLSIRAWNNMEPLFPLEDTGSIFKFEELEKKCITDIITNTPEKYF